MKFLNLDGDRIIPKLAAQFDYRGFVISASTIFTPYASIAILNGDGDILKADIDTVEDAIRLIDRGEV